MRFGGTILTFGGAQHGGRQRALLRFDVAQRKPTRIPVQHDGRRVSVRVVRVFVIFQNRQSVTHTVFLVKSTLKNVQKNLKIVAVFLLDKF